VTTKAFLQPFGLDLLRQAAGFRGDRGRWTAPEGELLAGDIPAGLANRRGENDV